MVCTIYVAKTKALISCTVTTQLICVFVFTYAKIRFSHDTVKIIFFSFPGPQHLLNEFNSFVHDTHTQYYESTISKHIFLISAFHYHLNKRIDQNFPDNMHIQLR